MNIEEAKEKLKYMANFTRDICVKQDETEAIETILAELDKKDKIIDLMAEYINELDIDEDICMKNTANADLCNEDYSKCKECIIEYFTKKVEEDK